MAALIGSVGVLFLSYVNPGMGVALLIAFAVAGATALVLLALLDVMVRRDLEPRQRVRWLLVALLAVPPVGAVVYLFLGRLRTAAIFRVTVA
jgi:hypothetical protein